VLAASQHSCGAQPGEKLTRVGDRVAWVGRNYARTHHAARGFKSKVENRSEVYVEAERAAVFADDLAVLAKELAISSGKDFGSGRRGAEDIAEAVDASTFEIDAGKERRGEAVLASAQEMVSLAGMFDVAGKKNYAGGLDAREQGSEARRHLGAVEADDQELADLCLLIVAHRHRHHN
jgi:hypothetical protein